ncbi:MAG: hypothetical protein PUF31_02165 [Oscillospiraceae bacterium]|nr:hypothetical protein [Oscillospiraceae bacterium]
MKDAKTLAYINLYGILGALENLCELDEEASKLAEVKKPISVGIAVKGGPSATLTFKNGRCRMEQGTEKCDVLLPFSSCEKFNGLIDGTVTPFPSKGFTHIGFLLKNFTGLTDILTKYLKADEEALKDEKFFETSTKLMFYLIVVAIAQIGNNDDIGTFSASMIPDGIVEIAIKNSVSAAIRVKDGHLVAIKQKPESYRAKMEFGSIKLARDLFDGNVNAVACIGEGTIEMSGLINMVDNINRILDRVAIYLA